MEQASSSSSEEIQSYKRQRLSPTNSWYTFWDAVVPMLCTYEQDKFKGILMTESVLKCARRYYQKSAEKLGTDFSNDRIIMAQCLHAIVSFGDVTLENICTQSEGNNLPTSQVGSNWNEHRDNAFEKMAPSCGASGACPVVMNGRLSNDSDFPAAGISYKGGDYQFDAAGALFPLTTQPDEQLLDACKEVAVPVLPYLTGACPTAPLPAWRNMPCNTVFLMQIVGLKAEIKPADLELLCQYGEAILRVSPERPVVFGVATNLLTCRFIAVVYEVDPDGRRRYRAYYSHYITENVADELAQFVATTPESHGHRFTFPAKHFVPHEYLGTGSTGAVFSGKWCGNSTDQLLALKTSIYPGALKLELVLLGYLERQGVQGVSQIHSAAQEDLSQPSLCGAYCNVYKSRKVAFLGMPLC